MPGAVLMRRERPLQWGRGAWEQARAYLAAFAHARPTRADLLWLVVLVPAVTLWLLSAWVAAGETGRFVNVDFAVYFEAGAALRLDPHADIYNPTVLRAAVAHADMRGCPLSGLPYLYPPSLAEGMIPFTQLPCGEVAQAWRLLGIVLWGGVTALLAVQLMRAWPRRLSILAASLAVTLSLLCFPLQDGLGLGQVTLPLLALLAIVPALDRRGRWGQLGAGALLAVAAAVKVLPVALLLYWALRRRWHALLGALVVGSMLLALAFVVSGPTALLAMRGAHLGVPGPDLNFSLWVLPGAGWSAAALVGSVTLGTVVAAPRRGDARLGYGWMLVALLLCGPLTWWNYTTWLLPTLVWCAARIPPTRWRHLPPLAALAAAATSLYAPAQALQPARGLVMLWALAGGLFVWSALRPDQAESQGNTQPTAGASAASGDRHALQFPAAGG